MSAELSKQEQAEILGGVDQFSLDGQLLLLAAKRARGIKARRESASSEERDSNPSYIAAMNDAGRGHLVRQ